MYLKVVQEQNLTFFPLTKKKRILNINNRIIEVMLISKF